VDIAEKIMSLFEQPVSKNMDPKTLAMIEQFENSVMGNPKDAIAYAKMGHSWFRLQEYARVLEHLNTAIQLDPQLAYALCARADLRATCPDVLFRDGEAAVRDATTALEIEKRKGLLRRDWMHRVYLQVLAAAYAESGNFASAIETEQEALSFTITKVARQEIEEHLTNYKLREPLRKERGLLHHEPSQNGGSKRR
jgi:tetratricopeptide (TPR) repeat protein